MGKKHRFTKHVLDKRRLLLAELPDRLEARQQHIHNPNNMLAATEAYNLKLEKGQGPESFDQVCKTVAETNAAIAHRRLWT